MTASRASPASEGGAFGKQFKANNANQVNESSINDSDRVFGLDGASDTYGNYRTGRNYRPLSRSPSPYRRKQSRSPSPYRNRRPANRSPSPYRHRDGAGRGHDKHDPRSHYKRKGSQSPPRGGRPDKRPYTDRNRNDHGSSAHGNDYRGGPYNMQFQKERGDPAERPSIKPISYAELDNPNAVPDFRDALPTNPRAPNNRNGNRPPGSGVPNNKGPSTNGASNLHATHEQKDRDVEMSNADDEPDLTPIVAEEKVPTEESREEKRRRWAAKRAAAEQKEKESLLHKAIMTNASEAGTPGVPSPAPYTESSVSPSASPRLGNWESAPASPDVMVVDKQGASSEVNSPETDGICAADYDPTQDMLDRLDKAAKNESTSELPSDVYNETDPRNLSILPAQKTEPVKKQKKEFDMFASDDEDEEAEDVEEQQNAKKGTVLDEKLLDNWDDPNGYYKIIGNELINNGRYRIIKPLGRGVFANVAQAVDVNVPDKENSQQLVAVKIIRRNDMLKKASQKEVDFLRKANEADPQDKKHIIRLLGAFDHKGHLCIVFEHMSKNLRDLLKEETNGHGLALPAVRIYAKQMFAGLQHLQNCQIVHLDLKPDNVLVSSDKKTVKLADFGTAVDKRDIIERNDELVSRFYRAVEIILGMEVGYPADMWAVGCTVYELWTGKILFTGNDNNQMIRAMIDCLGWPSEKLLRKGSDVYAYFDFGSSLKFISREVNERNEKIVRLIEQQKKVKRDLKTRVHDAAQSIATARPSAAELNDLADLLSVCLHMNVDKRVTPKEALVHKFFGNKNFVPKSAVVKPPMLKRGTPGIRR